VGSDQGGLTALEAVVDRAVRRIRDLEGALRESSERRDEAEALLQRLNDGAENPADMARRLEALLAENADLRARLDGGREAAERLLARVRYLEEQG